MKAIILKILHYLYSRRENIYSLIKNIRSSKNIKLDGKTNLDEILEYIKLIKNSGLVIDEKSENKVYYGAIKNIKENKHKILVQYDQSRVTCVIYSACRTFTYNTGINLSKDEIEAVVQYAKSKGWLNSKGMTFRNGVRALTGWLKENKNISINYDRIKYGSIDYQDRKNKGYSCMVGGYMSNKYITDFKLDGEINQSYDWAESKKYGHCFTEEEKFTDNYPSKFANNRYTNTQFDRFINKGYMFGYAYFIFLSEEVEVKKNITMVDKPVISDFEKFLNRGYLNHPELLSEEEKKTYTIFERILAKNNLK